MVQHLSHILRLPEEVRCHAAVTRAVRALRAGAGGVAVGVIVRVHSRRLESASRWPPLSATKTRRGEGGFDRQEKWHQRLLFVLGTMATMQLFLEGKQPCWVTQYDSTWTYSHAAWNEWGYFRLTGHYILFTHSSLLQSISNFCKERHYEKAWRADRLALQESSQIQTTVAQLCSYGMTWECSCDRDHQLTGRSQLWSLQQSKCHWTKHSVILKLLLNVVMHRLCMQWQDG